MSGSRGQGDGSLRGHRGGDLVLGRYRLRELLGSGASADVWLARDERLGRDIALKLLHPHLLPDATSRARFVAEARAAAAVRHPGIVDVHDVAIDGSTAAIVFELVEGESLETRLRRGPLPPVEAAEIAAELAEALAAAHAAGLVHRDVKPGNVLLDRSGRARLADFGIAQVLDEAQARLTRHGELIGTLRSLAPEQLAGSSGGRAADLYALGTVLYEMLAGRPPYQATTPAALAEQQRRPPAPLVAAPPGLSAIALRCLQPDPASRPSSAAEIAAYLRGWLAAARPASTAAGVRLPAAPFAPAVAGRSGFGAPSTSPAGGSRRDVGRRFDPNAATLGSAGSYRRSRVKRLGAASLAVAALAILAVAGLPLVLRGTAPPSTSGLLGADGTGRPAATASPTPPPSPSPTPSPSPSPTPSPSPSPSPTASPPSAALQISAPRDGAVVADRVIFVRGLAPAGSQVTRDVAFGFDDHVRASATGSWQMRVVLEPGPNVLTFRIDDDRSTDQQISVDYEP